MARIGLFLIILAMPGLPGSIRAQETVWYHSIGVEDGLSQNYVTAMAQDRDGFLWLGTVSGLNRFDGHQFQVHTHAPNLPGSLSNDTVFALHVDSGGGLWVGTPVGLDRYDPTTGRFVHYSHDPANARSPGLGQVRSISSDRTGRIWFATFWFDRSVLQYLDPATGWVTRFPPRDPTTLRISLLGVDSADRLWVATIGSGAEAGPSPRGPDLVAYDGCSGLGTGPLPPGTHPVALAAGSGAVTTLAQDHAGRLWFGQQGGGLTRYDPATGTQITLRSRPGDVRSLAGDSVESVAVDPAGVLWALAEDPTASDLQVGARLHRVDPESAEVTRINLLPMVPRPADGARLRGLMVDRSGVLWLSSDAGGLRSFDTTLGNFELYRPGQTPGMIDHFVRAVCLGRDGLLWIGTPKGLGCLHRGKDPAEASAPPSLDFPPLPSPDVQAIREDHRGALWIATRRGVVRWDRAARDARVYRHNPADPDSLADDAVQVIHEHPPGTLWFGTTGRGLSALDTVTGRFAHVKHVPSDAGGLPDNTIHALLSDRRGRLWVGTGAGLAVLGGTPGELRPETVAQDPARLGGRTVLAIAEDPAEPGVLWIGSQGLGLSRLDTATGACRHFSSRDSGLPNDTVYAVLCDESGLLWMSTNQGLVRYDPRTESFFTYGMDRHLQSLEFNARAHFQAPDGELFFGGVAGLNSLRPGQVRENLLPPSVCITKVLVFQRSAVSPASPFLPVYERGMRQDSLVLGPRERDLRFEFTALHFSNPRFNQCAYWLEGYDAGWREPVAAREATYTNLKPGPYTFHVRALSSHGVRSEATDTFSFVIRPPLYATPWFAAGGSLAVVALAFQGHRWRVRHLRRRERELNLEVERRTDELRTSMALVEQQARKLQELDQAKSRFFANISHEFRTPLTLTIGPLQDLREGLYGPLSADVQTELDLAVRNTRRLLELVEQLLTLARLDAGRLTLDAHETDLAEFVRGVVTSFEGLARRQRVQLALEIAPAPIPLPVDRQKLEQVVSNLLSNAFKHVPPEGRVTVRCRGKPRGGSLIEVEDTGPGIRPDDLPHLFERFYQAHESDHTHTGTGIGLSLARELVELHGGRLEVVSRLGEGSTFTIHLPDGTTRT